MKTTNKLFASFFLMAAVMIAISIALFNTEAHQRNYLSVMFLASVPFMVTSIVEMNGSKKIESKEKAMWTFGLIAMPLITGIAYLLSERKRVLAD